MSNPIKNKKNKIKEQLIFLDCEFFENGNKKVFIYRDVDLKEILTETLKNDITSNTIIYVRDGKSRKTIMSEENIASLIEKSKKIKIGGEIVRCKRLEQTLIEIDINFIYETNQLERLD
ncbi:MAG: hypothetical protein LBS95_02065 [Mycoplasmataceae bacterium]|jgi:hypothetical protein|nr:hypothetical protein [Mycoplasmataceae bacterium]